MRRLRLPAGADVGAAVIRRVFHVFGFDYDDATVDRACHDINDVINNFFYLHPPAVDDCPADAADARGVSGDP